MARAEVRDVLAWTRLLIDPHDAAAVVRALARPPIELRQVHLALVIGLARRRKLDLVSGVAAAREAPQVPPEARERIQHFVELHARAAEALDTLDPDAFIASLIEIVRARDHQLLAPEEVAQERAGLERLRRLAHGFSQRRPGSTPRELAAHLAAVAPERAGAGLEGAAARADAQRDATAQPPLLPPAHGEDTLVDRASHQRADSGQFAPDPDSGDADLQSCFQALRAEVLESVARIGVRLGELRLDTELDVAHAVVRYLELLKLSALVQRGGGQEASEALADVNARLLAAATPLQREIFQTSTLDETLLAGTPPTSAHQREERSLGPFLPRRGAGLALSASDIETYRSCPLRYKYSRVLRIPVAQTPQQRFGIVVHQVLERFHGERGSTLAQLLELLDAAWRRAGLDDGDPRLRELAREALTRYHARLTHEASEPVWFERPFAFRLGPHHLRGRVDRVDRLAPAAGVAAAQPQYELIDYKTSRPPNADELRGDVQLSLYALAAREAWGLESSRQAYYYVLDDHKVEVPQPERDAAAIGDLVLEIGAGIMAEAFEPTPSPATCSLCGYRIVCPVAAV